MKHRLLFLAFLLLMGGWPARAQTWQPVAGNLIAAASACNTPQTSSTPNCISLPALPNNAGAVSVSLTGTFSATVQFEAAGADGVFHALLMTPSGSATQASSATAAGLWTVNVSGMAGIRVRVSTYGSGTVVATINPSPTAAIFPGSGGSASCNGSGGDLTGACASQTVAAIQGTTVTLTTPAVGQVLDVTAGPAITNNYPGVPVQASSSATPAILGDGGSPSGRGAISTWTHSSPAGTIAACGSAGFPAGFEFGIINYQGSGAGTLTPVTSTFNGNAAATFQPQPSGGNPGGLLGYCDGTNYSGFVIPATDANGLIPTTSIAANAVTGAKIANNTVTATQLAVVQTRRVCDIPIGDTTGSAITNSQLGPQSRICFIPAAATIVEMDVNADAGTPNVIVGVNHAGSISNIVSGALATAASGGIACTNTGGTTGINGATTCTNTLQNTSLAAGDYLELVSGTAGGTAKFFVVHIIYTIS